MLFDAFDRVRIISLKHRKDRRKLMERQLAKIGQAIGGKVRFFDAISPGDGGPFVSRGSHGCFASHLDILSGEGSVLIIEDDCDFLPSIVKYRMPRCDIFYGGWNERPDPNDDFGDIIGSHLMGFGAEAARRAARYLQAMVSDPHFTPDLRGAAEPGYNPKIRPGIDGAYVWFRRANPDLVTVFENLSYQRRSRSDVTPGSQLDAIPLIRDLVEFGRRLTASIFD